MTRLVLLGVLLAVQDAAPVRTGLDVLVRDGFKTLQNKRVGLLTNHTGRDRNGRTTIDLFAQARGVTLVALFSPEHGIRGQADEKVSGGRDERTGLPIHSLYGKTTKPTPEMLQGLDVLAIDLQDAGARFYTYITTLALVMEAARDQGLEVVVLDRPNPVGGEIVEGPVLEESLRGDFIGYFPIPMRHGLTLGELARLYRSEFRIDCRLTVIPMEGWKRSMFYDETGLPWVNPSPNLRSIEAALSYPGLGALEATNLSVGRGTGRAFILYGAPYIDGAALCRELNARGLAGVRFKPATFTPGVEPGMPRYPFAEKECHGFEVEITDRREYRPVTAALHAYDLLFRMYPRDFQFGRASRYFGLKSVEGDLRAGKSPAEVEKSWQPARDRFLEARSAVLLYR